MLKRYSLYHLLIYIGLSYTLMMGCVSLTEADPTDDLRMSLGEAAGPSEVSHLISEDTVVRILSDHIRGLSRTDAQPLAKHLISLCKKHRLDPAFVLSLIDVESRFRAEAVSPAGAVGLMQIMAPTGRFILSQIDLKAGEAEKELPDWTRARRSKANLDLVASLLKEPFANITLGIAYLSFLRDYYKGMSPYYVLAAYNVGPARLDELLARKSFKPRDTQKYYSAIVRRVNHFRHYVSGTRAARTCHKRHPVM